MSEYGEVIAPGTIRFERLLPGPIERVWAYLTEPEKRAGWLAGGEMELRVGGAVELEFRHSRLSPSPDPPPERFRDIAEGHRMLGRITACDPPRLLRYTWVEESSPDSEVAFELEEHGDQVRLVLTHRRIGKRPAMIGAAGGWHAHLNILNDRLKGTAPGPFWAAFEKLESEYSARL